MSSCTLSRCCSVATRIVVMAVLFLLIFGVTALAAAFILSSVQDTPFWSATNSYIGMICGLIAWLFVAVFHFRKETIQLPIQDARAFGEQVKNALGDMGYEPTAASADNLDFRPNFQANLLGGGVQVKVEGQQARISGPKISVEALRKQLRYQNHLKKASAEETKNHGDRILKRAQITFRVPPEQWKDVFENVISPLSGEGEVVCQVSVSVQNDKGVTETAIDGPARQWLDQHGIATDVHKSHGQSDEPHRTGDGFANHN